MPHPQHRHTETDRGRGETEDKEITEGGGTARAVTVDANQYPMWQVKTLIMQLSERSNRHMKLNISFHNSSRHVGTLEDTNNWLALCHLGTRSNNLIASL